MRARGILFSILICLISFGGGAGQQAKADTAHCWCHVNCSIPGVGTYDSGDVPVSSGINRPYTTAKWNQCDTDCTNYLNNSLDMGAITAKANGYCGPVNCTSKHHIGTKDDRDGASRTVNLVCPVQPGEEKGPSQYAIKFVCGTNTVSGVTQPGTYSTVVNVHNPEEEGVAFRWKAAFAIGTVDGPITGFTQTFIGADAAQRYDCSLLPASIFADGFLVIQSAEPLDVTAYYTGGQPQVTSMAVKTAPRRPLKKVDLLCKANYTVPLALAASWTTSGGGPAVTVAGPNVDAATSAWDHGRTWISYDASGRPQLASPSYSYSMKFCSCGTGLAQGDVKSDNASSGTLQGPGGGALFAVGAPGNFGPNDQPVAFSKPITGAGNGSITLSVNNPNGPTGISLTGQLALTAGYAGVCRQ
jgi:hypothetical protein